MNKVKSLYSILTSIKIGYLREHKTVNCDDTQFNRQILLVLFKEGLISGFKKENNKFKIKLRYYRNKSIFSDIKTIYKPSLKKYSKSREINTYFNKFDLFIICTDCGLISSNQIWEYSTLNKKIGGFALIGISLMNKI